MLCLAASKAKARTMPDGQNLFLPATPQPPDPPVMLGSRPPWPELLVDQYRVMIADPAGNLVGMPAPVPLARMLQTNRRQIRRF